MGNNFVQILNLVREIKADNNVSVKHPIKKLMIKTNLQEDKLNRSAQNDLQTVCNAEVIQWSKDIQLGFETENRRFIVKANLY